MISASQKFFATKFAYWGLLFSKLSLISIGEGGRGGPTKFPGFQESSGGTIWNERTFHTFHTRYGTNKLGNMTTIILLIRLHFYDLHDPAFSASDSERAFLTIDFSFQHISIWRLGFGGFGVRENRGRLVSRITTVRRARVRRYHMAALHNSDFLYMLLLPKNASRSFWRIHVPATLLHITLASYTRNLHKAPPFLLLVITYSSR